MVDELKDISMPNEEEDYELLPHKEIEELKGELQKLKEFEITPTKKLSVSLLELNRKLDRLLAVFDEATHEIKTEEMGLTFKERMKPMSDKMDKILEQNADIAEGIVAIADMVKGKAPEKEELSFGGEEFKPEFPAPGVLPPMQQRMPPPMPPRQMPMAPPMPPRKPRTFGII